MAHGDVGQRVAINRPAACGKFARDPVLARRLFAAQARKAHQRGEPIDLASKVIVDGGVDALAALYHVDHRELCAHERDWPFPIVNVLEIVGESMGISEADHFKRLKIMQDADAIVEDCQDLIARHGIDAATARQAVAGAMLGE